MIRASIGTWINYATTFALQVLFASHFGASSAASAFALTFTASIAVSGMVVSSLQSVIVPRLLDPSGRVVLGAIKVALALVASTVAILGACLLFADAIGVLISGRVPLSPEVLGNFVRLSLVFTIAQLCAGALATYAMAHRHLFASAVSPAGPSLVAALWLSLYKEASIADLYLLLTLGTLAQSLFLVSILWRRYTVASIGTPRTGPQLTFTLLQFAILAACAPIEQALATGASPDDGAHFYYALRSLASVQQLLVGGFLIAALAEWSVLFRTAHRPQLNRALSRTLSLSLVLFVLAASIAVVAASSLVALFFEHGQFSSADTEAVASLLRLALPGFCAEGVGLLLSQALLASRRNTTAIWIGILRFIVRVSLAAAFVAPWGAQGVAAAYSISMSLLLVVQVAVLLRIGILDSEAISSLSKPAAVSLLTAAAAIGIEILAPGLPDIVSGVLVILFFFMLVTLMRPAKWPRFGRA